MNNNAKLETFFIFSTKTESTTPKEEIQREEELEGVLHSYNIRFKRVTGSYKGVTESSYLVVGNDKERVVAELAKAFEQECYLKVDETRQATLIGQLGNIEIGTWTELQGARVDEPAWTLDPSTNTAYYCRKA